MVADTTFIAPHTSFVGKYVTVSNSSNSNDNSLFCAASLTGDPPPREWVVDGFIPKGSVTGMFGSGGVGKSLLAQQLGTALVTGSHWLGLETTKNTVISYFCEDDRDELWRRQCAINSSMHIDMQHSDLNDFHMQSRFGMDNIMMKFTGSIGERTAFFSQIEQDVSSLEATFVILDNAAQMYGGNENERREVTQFVNSLHGLVLSKKITILLLGHPPKQSATNQSDYSGSTAWDACFRSRLYLGKVKEDEEYKDDNYHRFLSKRKANYSTTGNDIILEWDKGFFKPLNNSKDMVDSLEEAVKKNDAKQHFLSMLDHLTTCKLIASHSNNSPNYAPKIMLSLDLAKKKKLKMGMLKDAMMTLILDQEIAPNQEVYKRDGHPVCGLKRVQKPT